MNHALTPSFDPYLTCSGVNIIPHKRNVMLCSGLYTELRDELSDFIASLELPGEVRGAWERIYSDPALARASLRSLRRSAAERWALEGVYDILSSRHSQALIKLERAAAIESNRAWTHFWIFLATYASSRLRRRPEGYPEALSAADRAIQLDASVPWFYLHRASILADFGRNDEAVDDFNRALELKPGFARFHFERGRMLAEIKRGEDAMPDVKELIRLFPGRGFSHAIQSLAAIESHKNAEALAAIDRAVSLERGSGVLRAWRGEIRRKAGLYQEALADFDRSFEIGSVDPLHYAWRGKARLTVGRIREAADDLDCAIRTHAHYKTAYAWRAEAFYKLRRYRQAVADAERIFPLNLESTWSCGVGSENPARGELRKERFLSELEIYQGRSAGALVFQGITLSQSSDPALRQRARSLLEDALRLSPCLAAAHAFLGIILDEAGDPSGLDHIERALKLSPAAALYHFFKAEALSRRARRVEAIEEFRRALAKDGMLRPVWPRYGRVLLELGRLQEAAAALDVAACLEPRNWGIFLDRAKVRRRFGDLRGAKLDLESARIKHAEDS